MTSREIGRPKCGHVAPFQTAHLEDVARLRAADFDGSGDDVAAVSGKRWHALVGGSNAVRPAIEERVGIADGSEGCLAD